MIVRFFFFLFCPRQANFRYLAWIAKLFEPKYQSAFALMDNDQQKKLMNSSYDEGPGLSPTKCRQFFQLFKSFSTFYLEN